MYNIRNPLFLDPLHKETYELGIEHTQYKEVILVKHGETEWQYYINKVQIYKYLYISKKKQQLHLKTRTPILGQNEPKTGRS